MKLKTVRVRRSNPSALALALAVMLTMLCVYLISLSALPEKKTSTASGQAQSTAEIRMEGLESGFLLYARSGNHLEARVLAAKCADNGGAGLILSDGGDYCIISEAVSHENTGTNDLRLSADGLTLKLQGASNEITAISDAAIFLRNLATETGGLAASVEDGNTDLPSVCSLFDVYQTQGQKVLESLNGISPANEVISRLSAAVQGNLTRIESARSDPDLGKIKLIHAAACAEWISILEEFASGA